VKFVKGIYNRDRYIPHGIEILHIYCNTLLLSYNIPNLNLSLYICYNMALRSTVQNNGKTIKVM
jgi:hypothetical protein